MRVTWKATVRSRCGSPKPQREKEAAGPGLPLRSLLSAWSSIMPLLAPSLRGPLSFGGVPMPKRPIAIYHEHPDWFRPLFAEMDRRGTPYVRVDARRHHYDIAAREREYSLLF